MLLDVVDAFAEEDEEEIIPGPGVPDPVTFVLSRAYMDRGAIVYPRQMTLMKLIFLRTDLMTEYDHKVIDGWIRMFMDTNPDWAMGEKFSDDTNGIQPDIYVRIEFLRERGYRWFREVILALGRRAGKGYVSSLAMTYVLWNYIATGNPQRHYGIDEGKQIACAIFAGKRDQAIENLWGDLNRVITEAPCFTPYISNPLGQSLTVYAPHDFVRLRRQAARGIYSTKDQATFRIIPRESVPLSARGPAGAILGFDEAAHVTSTGVTREFGDVYKSATPSLGQFGRDGFICIPSSTWEMIGKFYELWDLSLQTEPARDGEGIDGRVPTYWNKFMLQLTSWDIYLDWEDAHNIPLFPEDFKGDLGEYENAPHPKLNKLRGPIECYDEEMQKEEQADPDTFRVERRSGWQTALDAYLNKARVDDMFAPWEERDPDWGPPQLEMQKHGLLVISYRAHGDPSEVNNRFGFAMAHQEPGPTGFNHAVFDLIHFWDPADFPDHMVDYDVIIDWIIENVVLPFQPEEVTFDQFNSAASVPRLQKEIRKHANRLQKNISAYIRTATAPLNWQTAQTFKAALNMRLVHAPLHLECREELRFLQKPEGQQKVIAATSGPVQTKDIADCHHRSVEVLTEHGWKLFKDVLDGERVATRNERGELEYQHFTHRIARHYAGPMYQYEGQRLNFSVTPGHRMLVRPWASGDWRFIRAEDLAPGQRYAIPKTTTVTGRESGIIDVDDGHLELPAPVKGRGGSRKGGSWSEEEDAWLTEHYASESMDVILNQLPGRTLLSAYNRAKQLGLKRGQIGDRHADRPKPLAPVSRELFAQFLGFWLAEGRKYHSGTHRGYGVKITQTKAEGIAWFNNLLLKLGWPYTRHESPKEFVWEIKSHGLREYLRALCTGDHELHIPDEAFTTWTIDEMRALLHGLSMGDGSFSTELQRYTYFCSSSRQLVDDVQRLMLHIGMSGRVRQIGKAGDATNFPGYFAKHDRWAIHYETKGSGIAGVIGHQIEQVDYDGMVYCLTVPNGTLLVRRKGAAMWAGNCVMIVTHELLGEQMNAFLRRDLANQRPAMAMGRPATDPYARFDPAEGNPYAGQLGAGLARGMHPGQMPGGRPPVMPRRMGAASLRRHRS